MHTDSNHPGLQKYRAIREERKKMAILKNGIREANPEYTESQVQAIAEASLRAQETQSINIRSKGKKRKGRGKRDKPVIRKVEVQVVNPK